MFVNSPPASTPGAELLRQLQGMIAEYERAQILERTRRGKQHRARQGSVNVLSGAPSWSHVYHRGDARVCDATEAGRVPARWGAEYGPFAGGHHREAAGDALSLRAPGCVEAALREFLAVAFKKAHGRDG